MTETLEKEQPILPPRAFETMEKLCKEYSFTTVLDVGSGDGRHSDYFRSRGKEVTGVDIGRSVNYTTGTAVERNYMDITFPNKFDVVWCCHTLEHQRNPGAFLEKLFHDLKEGGFLCITVPPRKPQIVSGHVSLWNMGLLLYHLVLAGFDCREAIGACYGYNISIILQKKTIHLPELTFDRGDIELLQDYFPLSVHPRQGFDGDIRSIGWDTSTLPPPWSPDGRN